MDSLMPAIRAHLATLSDPESAHAIADAVATTADANEVRNLLGAMVKNGKVVRHHNPDGILRYSLAAVPLVPPARPRTAPAQRIRNGMPIKQDQLLEILGTQSLTCAELTAASLGVFSCSQVSNLVQMLRRNQLIVRDGTAYPMKWKRAACQAAAADAGPAAAKAFAGVAGLLVRPGLAQQPSADPASAIADTVTSAEAALEQYIESCVDKGVYDRMLQALVQAYRAHAALAMEAP